MELHDDCSTSCSPIGWHDVHIDNNLIRIGNYKSGNIGGGISFVANGTNSADHNNTVNNNTIETYPGTGTQNCTNTGNGSSGRGRNRSRGRRHVLEPQHDRQPRAELPLPAWLAA